MSILSSVALKITVTLCEVLFGTVTTFSLNWMKESSKNTLGSWAPEIIIESATHPR